MFDIGWTELLVIGVVALIAIGPKELPGVLRTVGLWAGKIRRMANDFQGQFHEAMREAEIADLKNEIDSAISGTTSKLTSAFDPFAASPTETKPAVTKPADPLVPTDVAAVPVAPDPTAPAPAPTETTALPPPAETAAPLPPAAPTALSALDFGLPPIEPPPPLTEKDFAIARAPPAEPKPEKGAA